MVRRKNGERSEKEEKKKKRDKDSTTAGSRKRTLSVTTRYAPSSSESEDLDAIWAQKRSHRTLTLYTFKRIGLASTIMDHDLLAILPKAQTERVLVT